MLRSSIIRFLSKFIVFCFVLQAITSTLTTASFAADTNLLSLDIFAVKNAETQGLGEYKILSVENNELTLEYEIKGKEFGINQPNVPTEIALILDLSSSMQSSDSIDDLQKATLAFIETLNTRSNVKVALVPFARYSNPKEYFDNLQYSNGSTIGGGGIFYSTNSPLLKDQAANLKVAGSGTNIADAIRVAYNLLIKSSNSNISDKYVVLMTDGQATAYNTQNINDFVKSASTITQADYISSSDYAANTKNPFNPGDTPTNYAIKMGEVVSGNEDAYAINTFSVLYNVNTDASATESLLKIARSLSKEKGKFDDLKLFENSNITKLDINSNTNELNKSLNNLGIYFSSNKEGSASDLEGVFNKISSEIAESPRSYFEMPVDFTTILPSGIGIDDIVKGLEINNRTYSNVSNSNIQIKYKKYDKDGVPTETEYQDLPVDILTDCDPAEKGSNRIKATIDDMSLVLQTKSGKYKSPDVVLRIKVKLLKPATNDSVVLSRIKSELDYNRPTPIIGDLDKRIRETVNANNDVVFSLPSYTEEIKAVRDVINPAGELHLRIDTANFESVSKDLNDRKFTFKFGREAFTLVIKQASDTPINPIEVKNNVVTLNLHKDENNIGFIIDKISAALATALNSVPNINKSNFNVSVNNDTLIIKSVASVTGQSIEVMCDKDSLVNDSILVSTNKGYSFAPVAASSAKTSKEAVLGVPSEIKYKIEGNIDIKVPPFPSFEPPVATPIPIDQKEIIFLLDSSMYFSKGEVPTGGVLDYVLYSDTDINVIGEKKTFNGSVHTNKHFNSEANDYEIKEGYKIEYGTKHIGAGLEEKLEPYLKQATKILSIEQLTEWPAIINESILVQENAGRDITGDDIHVLLDGTDRFGSPKFKVTGSGILNLGKSLYFPGSVTFSVRNITGNGQAFIFAAGDITIQGYGASNDTTMDRVCFFSKMGDIKFESDNSSIKGLAIAASGEIVFQGRYNDFVGNFISNKITIKSSFDTFTHPGKSTDYPENLNDNYEPHPHYDILVQKLWDLIDSYDEHKIGIIQFDSSANSSEGRNNRFELFNMSNTTEKEELKNHITDNILSYRPGNNESNLGDALRRAYMVFNSVESNPNVPRYLVVLTGISPTTYSHDDDLISSFLDDTHDTRQDSAKAIEYAKAYSEKLFDREIKSFYVDLTAFTGQSNAVLYDIATVAGVSSSEFKGTEYVKAEDNGSEALNKALVDDTNSVKAFLDKVVEIEEIINEEIPGSPVNPDLGKVNILSEVVTFIETLPEGVIPKGIKFENKDYIPF
ncbi:MAG: VWA domain-containing protein, partial [Clostridiaceae bacterium]|nr:VWA domain-containing protein [Clostridiaceae bacterium]